MKTTKLFVSLILTTLLFSQFAAAQVSRPIKYKNGNVYNGNLDEATRPSGYGTMQFANGDRYDGEWQKGMYHGKGIYTYAAGGRCEGTWEKGKMVGKGFVYYPNGDVIEAEFTDGASQTGNGKFTYATGG